MLRPQNADDDQPDIKESGDSLRPSDIRIRDEHAPFFKHF